MYFLYEVDVYVHPQGWLKEFRIYLNPVELADNKTRKNCKLRGTSNDFPRGFPIQTNEGDIIEDLYFKRNENL